MAAPDAVEFATRVAGACQASPIVQSYSVSIQDNVLVKVRADLRPDLFVDVFYNAVTGKTSFALIRSSVRLYGVDNTTSWHVHPFEDPDSHQTCPPMEFEVFLQRVEEWLSGNLHP